LGSKTEATYIGQGDALMYYDCHEEALAAYEKAIEVALALVRIYIDARETRSTILNTTKRLLHFMIRTYMNSLVATMYMYGRESYSMNLNATKRLSQLITRLFLLVINPLKCIRQ
jgi:hypothetical protein